MSELPMAALARGRKLAVHLAPPCLDLALALARLPAFPSRLHATRLVILGRILRAALAIKLSVQAAQVLPVGGHLGAEGLEQRLLLGDHGKGARPQVESND